MKPIPARMRAAPKRERRPKCSCRTRKEVRQAKTGSRVRRIAVWVGGRCCWAQLWIVKAAAVARRLVITSAMRRRGVTDKMRSSAERQGNGHYDRCHANLERGELAGGDPMRGVGQDSRWAAKAIAQKSVRRSPTPMLREILPGGSRGVVRRRRPEKARMSADGGGPAGRGVRRSEGRGRW